MMDHKFNNADAETVDGFGREWTKFDQATLPAAEAERIFDAYFSLVDWDLLPADSVALDIGCGSGRWAALVSPKVGKLHLVDASASALSVARRNLSGSSNCEYHHASVEAIPVPDASVDLIYSLGVLHHVPDTALAITSAVRKLKPGGIFLVYLYYRFDNRNAWFRVLWKISDLFRRIICKLPFRVKSKLADLLAAFVYFPLAKLAQRFERQRKNVTAFPLSAYRDKSLYTMRTDALDRFGTKLEQRFTKYEITSMLESAGLSEIKFRTSEPFWCAVGRLAK
jgi:ubiquinone/menaquinone biosynthesis C-methylase UbiE